VLEGTDTLILEKGPGHWEETPLPGEGGRCVISAHRTAFGSLFLRLDELEPGDAIELRMPYGVMELSLASCHPPGSDEFRLVVNARAVGYRQTP